MGAKIGHKVSIETRIKISLSNRGQVAWNKGVYPKKAICKICKKEFTYTAKQARNKKTCSNKCRYELLRRKFSKEKLGYSGLHEWVRRNLGRPETCEHCGIKQNGHKIHWANKSGEYKKELSDWLRLCVPCHSKHDRKMKQGYIQAV